jgi:hypothetical protein
MGLSFLRAHYYRAGQELLETVLLDEGRRPRDLLGGSASAQALAAGMGLARLSLLAEFPVVNASFGYSREEYTPNLCRLNPFPPEQRYEGRFPIYVDEIQGDALLLQLDSEVLVRWLDANGYHAQPPGGTDASTAIRSYPVVLFDDVPLRSALHADRAQARLTMCLLHTFAHLSLREAALVCGLDSNSLSEYLLPRTLSFVIYANQRFGAKMAR